MTRPWKSCDECKTNVRKIRLYKGKALCYRCYSKSLIGHMMPTIMDAIYDEPLTKHSMNVFINLTASQAKFLKDRRKRLGLKTSQYIRNLIEMDRVNQEDKDESFQKG